MAAAPPPLSGIRVVELAGLAPAPFASLLLADYGASVLRIDRASTYTSTPPPPTLDTLTRHKSSIALDLKNPSGLALLNSLLSKVDVLIDPYRPGVLESLGLDPERLLTANPRLIIARLTGFRREGVYSQMAGHDINYLAVSGILSQLGRANEAPYAPGNIVADFAGGGLMCVLGILMALTRRTQTGKGQVLEANMVDGSAYLGSFMRYARKTPLWDQPRGENHLDGGCPWYDVYQCRDGGCMAVGALEPKFFMELLECLEVDQQWSEKRYDRREWPALRNLFTARFLEEPRKHWEEVFEGKDACCTPVLEQSELEDAGYEQRPAVGLTGSPGLKISQEEAWQSKGLAPGQGGEKILSDWMGWRRGKDYDLHDGGLIKLHSAKL